MLAGPNISLYQHLSALLPGVAVQASGGIRDVADVAEARRAGCGGAILARPCWAAHGPGGALAC